MRWALLVLAALTAGACGGDEASPDPWDVQLGTDAADTSFGVAAGPDGGVVVAAASEGPLAGTHNGKRDIVVIGFSADGEQRWSTQIGGDATDSPLGVSVAPDGSVYVSGFTEGDFASANAGSADVFLLKLDADGNELWRQQFGGDGWDRGFDVTAFDGGAYVSGYTASVLDEATNTEGFDGFAARFDDTGTLEWLRQVGTDAADWGQGSALAPDDGLYLTGYTEGLLGEVHAGGKDAFVTRLGPDGTVVWSRQFGTEALDWPQGVGVTADGGVLLAGSTEGDLAEPNAGLRDGFLAGFDADGAPTFTTQFGTSGVDSVFEVRAVGDRIVATGSTEGDLGGLVGERDGLLVWLDRDGTVTSIEQLGSTAVDDLTGLAVAESGAVIYTGGTFGELAGPSAGDSDVVVGSTTDPADG